jgi:SAM-dependent methyltransferase
MASLEQLIATIPAYAGMKADEATRIERLLVDIACEISGSNGCGLLDHLAMLGPALFADVNAARPAPEFDAAVEVARSHLRDSRSLQLELGTSRTWPDFIVDHHIATERLGDFIRLDMDATALVDVRASATALPFADESIDHISSTSLFEHCAYPHEIIREAFRVLRPGGSMYVKAPFHFVEHKCPADYLRFTGQFFTEVCGTAGFADVEVEEESTSGVYYVAHQMLKAGVAVSDHPNSQAARRGHLLATALLGMLQTMDGLFHSAGRSLWHTTCALATKPGVFESRATGPDRTLPFIERYAEILICPRSGLPLQRTNRDQLVSLDGRNRYDVRDGVPDLFVLHGFGSSFQQMASSRSCAKAFQQAQRSVA